MTKFFNIVWAFLNIRSVHFRITLFLSVAIIITGSLGIYNMRQEVNSGLQDVISDQQNAFAIRVASEIDRNIMERLTFVHSLAKKTVQSGALRRSTFDVNILNDFVVSSYFPDGIYILNPKMQLIAKIGDHNLQNEIPFHDFTNILKRKNERSLSPPFKDELGTPMMLFGSPMVDDESGNILGYMIGAVDIARKEMVGDLLSLKIGEGGYAYLFEPERRLLLLHPDRSRSMRDVIAEGKNTTLDRGIVGFQGSNVGTNSLGITNLISVRKIPSTGWILGINYPVDEAFAPVRDLRNNLTLVLGIGALFTIFLVYFLSLGIVRPLMAVSKNMQMAGEHFENAMPLEEGADDDIGYLTRSYNKLLFMFQEEMRRRTDFEHKLKGSEAYLRDITETLGDGLIVTNENDEIVFINPKACEMIGVSELFCKGQSLSEILHFPKSLPPSEVRALIKDPFQSDAEIIRNGRSMEIATMINPLIKDDQFSGWVVSFRDISERKQFERDITDARLIAEKASQAKSEFLAHISHEIRTPMNGILGMTEQLLNEPITHHQRDLASMVQGQAESLLLIINDILSLSKIESGQLTLCEVPFSLEKMTGDLSRIFDIRCREKNLRLHLDIHADVPVWLHADELKIRQILINLLGNALKFTHSGEIAIRIRPSVGGMLEFSVRDSGIGIPEDKVDSIFEAFQQADAFIERKYGGTGLGLTICKKFIDKMGGRIWVQSKVGRGSSFYFTIPLKLATPEQIATLTVDDEKPLSKSRQLFILLAEDNVVNQKFFEIVIHNAGHTLLIASDGEEAIRMTRDNPGIDVIFMDIQMPKKNGIQATEDIRALGYTMPIVGLSAHAMEGFKDEVMRQGFSDFLSKPISGKSLINYLDRKFGHEAGSQRIDTSQKQNNQKTFSTKQLEEDFGWTREEFFLFMSMTSGQLTNAIDDLDLIFDGHDFEVAHKVLHALKGTLGTIQADRAHALCTEMDEQARQGTMDKPELQWTTLREMLVKIQEEINMSLQGSDN